MPLHDALPSGEGGIVPVPSTSSARTRQGHDGTGGDDACHDQEGIRPLPAGGLARRTRDAVHIDRGRLAPRQGGRDEGKYYQENDLVHG